MKKITIMSGALNGSYAEVPATTQTITGKLKTLKKDGSYIEGRHPLPEEHSLLWNFVLSTKERIDKNNTRLKSTLYIPEEGIDQIDEGGRHKIAMDKHLKNHYLVSVPVFKDGKKEQSNPNFRKNPPLYFEYIDESAAEEIQFNKRKSETRACQIVDEIYEADQSGKGEFMELCYGVGIARPHDNTRFQNYNLIMNKIGVNPQTFHMYWNDSAKSYINTINKGMRIKKNDVETYIYQNGTGIYIFNELPVGTNLDEMKVYFQQHTKEYEYLCSMVNKKVKPVDTSKDVKGLYNIITMPPAPEKVMEPEFNSASVDTQAIMAEASKQAGRIISAIKNEKTDDNCAEQITKAHKKFSESNHGDYFMKKLSEKAIEKGVPLPQLELAT